MLGSSIELHRNRNGILNKLKMNVKDFNRFRNLKLCIFRLKEVDLTIKGFLGTHTHNPHYYWLKENDIIFSDYYINIFNYSFFLQKMKKKMDSASF